MEWKIKILIFLFIFLNSCEQPIKDAKKVTIDVLKVTGNIRPINGGNLGPVCHQMMLDMMEEFLELDITVIRTHDVPWFSMPAVDVHTKLIKAHEKKIIQKRICHR